MTLAIPKIKDGRFSSELFSKISDALSDLKIENGKWPDSMVFSGPLGKDLFNFIEEKGWDLFAFNPKNLPGPNKIIFEYSKPLSQIEEKGTLFDSSFSEKTINGIPGKETISKIIQKYAAPAFTIERTVRPKKEIKLIRQ